MPDQDSPWRIVNPVQLDINDYPSYQTWRIAQGHENDRARVRNLRVAYRYVMSLDDIARQTGVPTFRVREYLAPDLTIHPTPYYT